MCYFIHYTNNVRSAQPSVEHKQWDNKCHTVASYHTHNPSDRTLNSAHCTLSVCIHDPLWVLVRRFAFLQPCRSTT